MLNISCATPKLTAQQIHNAFDALGDVLLPRESNQFLSHGLLPEKEPQRKKIAGKWTIEKLFKKYNRGISKELRGALGYHPGTPCQDFIRHHLHLPDSSIATSSSSTSSRPEYRLPCPEDMDSLVFSAVRLRDPHCSAAVLYNSGSLARLP